MTDELFYWTGALLWGAWVVLIVAILMNLGVKAMNAAITRQELIKSGKSSPGMWDLIWEQYD